MSSALIVPDSVWCLFSKQVRLCPLWHSPQLSRVTLARLVSVLTRATQLAPHYTAREWLWLLWGFLLIALYWVSADHLPEAHGSGSGGALCAVGQNKLVFPGGEWWCSEVYKGIVRCSDLSLGECVPGVFTPRY